MPRHVFILFLAWIVPALVEVRADSWSGKSVDFSHGDLCVSPNGRFLQHTDGTPFLYLGDTAWELIYRDVYKRQSMQSVSNIPKFAYESRWTPDNTENAKWPRATMAQTREWRISDRCV